MNNPFDYSPGEACHSAFQALIEKIEALRGSDRAEDEQLCRELDAGKMLGVLIAEDDEGGRHTLYAFSGQIGNGGFYFPGFVAPVFDYLSPEGYFKVGERAISAMNREIEAFEKTQLAAIREEYELQKAKVESDLALLKEKYRVAKLQRQARRDSGECDAEMLAAMIRQSQFEKAELNREKKNARGALEPFAERLKVCERELEAMKAKRRSDSEALQQWLFDNFKVLNAKGESKSLSEIFAATSLRVPPSGAGECCAPKLLQEAYLKGWKPVEIAEYWYGAPKGGEIRRHGEHYPACRGKCGPVLGWMLRGLEVTPPLDSESDGSHLPEPEIIYEDEWICVINKPSGMLSVPGKGAALSVQQWLGRKYGVEKEVKPAHRLDQDTSGLLIATFDQVAYKEIQRLFATGKVKKTYIADLEGDYRQLGLEASGEISLPLSPDWLDRPRQRVDHEAGKPAVTSYDFLGVSAGRSRVILRPHTGRTHQLRVHAASSEGLAMPIAGDRLYGKNGGRGASRLHLHAGKIKFTFPLNGRTYSFEAPQSF